jgi:hypothetical protein
MKQEATITLFPSDVLREIVSAMNGQDTDIKVTLPLESTWKKTLRATLEALGESDGSLTISPSLSEKVKEHEKELLLSQGNVKKCESANLKTLPGLPIRTTYDIATLPTPERASEKVRKILRDELLKDIEKE